MIFNKHDISILAQLGAIEVGNGDTQLREAYEFLTVDAGRISKYTAAINDGNCLVGTEENLVYKLRQMRSTSH